MTCHVWQLGPGDAPWNFAADWDYSPGMVEAIKTHVPSRSRAWQPTLRRWCFKQAMLDTVLALADEHCHGWQYGEADDHTTGGGTHRAMPLQLEVAYSRLHLRPTAPPELVVAAYKTLAKLHHPDHGGDDGTMGEINEAYQLVTGRG